MKEKKKNSKAQIIVREGVKAEEDFVKAANMDISLKNPIWKFFVENEVITAEELREVCMVRCNKNQYSKIAKKKTAPKSDAFIACGENAADKAAISSYLIKSGDLDKLNLKFKPNSGISIKKDGVEKVQIQKFSVDPFEAFMEMGKDARYLGAGVSLYVMKPEEIEENISKVFSNWKVEPREIFDYFENFLEGVKFESFIDYSNAGKLQNIKKYCKKKVKEIIQADSRKMDIIFRGEHNFEDPYKAPWIYEKGTLCQNKYMDFSIDAGSGRKTIDIGR